MFYLGIP